LLLLREVVHRYGAGGSHLGGTEGLRSCVRFKKWVVRVEDLRMSEQYHFCFSMTHAGYKENTNDLLPVEERLQH
jgi:hypothetical protein